MTPLTQSLLATLAISTIAFAGVIVLVGRTLGRRGEVALLSFAAGVLLATSFLELVPEATRLARDGANPFVASLLAMIGFFLLEWFLHGFHSHEEAPHGHQFATPRYLVLVGDGLHNFIDGLVIAASFAVGPELGLATTFAVAVHEVPQEIADLGILIAGGYSRVRALVLNFLSGLTAVLGALVFFAVAPDVHHALPYCMAATAGMFIYIAGSDLIPQLHEHQRGGGGAIQLPFLVGVALIAVLEALS
jgi:zinc and cadmium transporter